MPGFLKGIQEAHKIGGKLPLSDLFQPSIDLCFNGLRVSEYLAFVLSITPDRLLSFSDPSWFYETWINKTTNRPYVENDIITWKKYGYTLKLIQEKGIDYFYNGELAKIMTEEIQENGNLHFPSEDSNFQNNII